MSKLYLKSAYEFENPSKRVFKEGGGELFGATSGQAAKINAWVGGKESSSEAKALAESVSKQAEEIREGTRKELLELYVNIFTDTIPQKEVYNMAPLTVDATYAKNGLLQVLEKNSSDLRVVFQGTPDLRLLSYATVYKNFKTQGLDANYLPIGAKVELVNGDVTVTYTENGVTKTATSEIFPWSTYETAHRKYLEVLGKERAEEARRIEEAGGPQDEAVDEEVRDILKPSTPDMEPPVPVAIPEGSIQEIRSVLEGQPVEKQVPFLNHEVDRLVAEVNKTYGEALFTKQGRERMKVLGTRIQEANVWYADLERTPPADKTALDAVKKKVEYLNSFPLFKPKMRDKDALAAPAEPISAAPDRKTLKQNAQVAADALELSTRLDPERIAEAGQNYTIGAGVKVDQFLKQYVKAPFQYLTPTDRRWPEPNGDGSAEWSMDFRTAEGETFRIVAKTPALDLTKVRTFLEAQAALGNSKYKEADIIKYLALRAVSEEFKKSIDSTRRELKLDEKYGAYLRSHILDTGPIESSLTVFPGLPNGDYVHISSLDLDDGSPISGKRTLTCMDGVVFQGELKDNVPSGTAGLWLKNREMIGPMEFVDGKATVNHTDGTIKEVTWNRDSSSFEIKNI